MRSVVEHNKKAPREFQELTDDDTKMLLDKMESRYLKQTPGLMWSDTGKLLLNRATIAYYVQMVSGTGSTGLPWMSIHREKGLFRDKDPDILVDAVYNRLLALLSIDYSNSKMELVENDCVDPVRIFIKQEFHKQKKIDTHTERIISSISVVDEIVERMLTHELCQLEIEKHAAIPSKVGLSTAADADAKVLWYQYGELLGEAAESDVSSFDWCVTQDKLNFLAKLHIRLSGMPEDSDFAKICRARFHCLGQSVYSLSDGTIFELEVDGHMKSGSYFTASQNSKLRVAFSILAGAEWAIAYGDDCLEQYVDGAVEVYERYGFKMKAYNKCDKDSFSFCSHVISDKPPVPVNHVKTFLHFLSEPVTVEKIAQFRMQLRHCPRLPYYLAVINTCGVLAQ